MKVRITYEHEAAARAADGTFEWKNGRRIRPVGMILDGLDVFKLVGCGLAEPADDECAALFTPEQIQQAKATGHPYLMANLQQRIQEQIDDKAMEEFIEEGDDE